MVYQTFKTRTTEGLRIRGGIGEHAERNPFGIFFCVHEQLDVILENVDAVDEGIHQGERR